MMRRDLFPTANRDLRNQAANREFAPRDPFTALQSEMMRFFDDLRRGAGDASLAELGGVGSRDAPQLDIQEDANNVHVTAELPGMSEDDVELTYHDGVLRIAGEKRQEQEDQDDQRQVHVTERSYGRFEREIPLNRAIDEENIAAQFKDGVLRIALPKREEGQQGRRIEVQREA